MRTPATSPDQVSAAPPPVDAARWFAEEVHPHDVQLKAYLRGSFPSVRDVEDVVQESYVRIWRRQLRTPVKSAKSFLFKVARHLAVDLLRHERASPFEAVTDLARSSVLDGRPSAADAAATHQEMELLVEAIEALPGRCREIVVLRKLQRMPQKEIARRLGISEQTVQVQATRGLRRCEEFLRRRGVVRNPKP